MKNDQPGSAASQYEDNEVLLAQVRVRHRVGSGEDSHQHEGVLTLTHVSLDFWDFAYIRNVPVPRERLMDFTCILPEESADELALEGDVTCVLILQSAPGRRFVYEYCGDTADALRFADSVRTVLVDEKMPEPQNLPFEPWEDQWDQDSFRGCIGCLLMVIVIAAFWLLAVLFGKDMTETGAALVDRARSYFLAD